MTIENFSVSEFQAALPAGKWSVAPVRDGQFCYTVAPYPRHRLGDTGMVLH